MCVRDSYVYQKGVLCCLINESYVRWVGRYCFVRNYAAVPVQLIIIMIIICNGLAPRMRALNQVSAAGCIRKY
jgi:hypothetical protein